MSETHGAKPSRAGYVRGCRCRGCSEANRVYLAEYRRRRAGGGPLVPAPAVVAVPAGPAGPGPIEAAVAAQLAALASTVPWAGTWRLLALQHARGLDECFRTGQYSVASVLQSRLRDCIDRLGAGAPRGPEDAPGWTEWAADL